MNVPLLCSRIIKVGFYLLFTIVPLLLTPWNYELFEYNKMMAVYALTVIIASSWLVKMIAEKEIKISRTPLDIPIALFVISQFVSSLFSIDPHVSWFGYYSRFNGGMWSIISYVVLYYAFLSNWTNWTHLSNLVKTMVASASVVALYGVAERLGIDKNLWVQDVQNRVFSTLGQPNWLAAYLVALSPIAWALALRTQASKSVFWILVSILFFLVLLFTRSRSGLLGFAVADILFWGLVFTSLRSLGELRKKLLQQTVALHIIFALVIFFNGSNIAQIDRYFSFAGLRDLVMKKTVAPAPTAPQTAPLLEVGGTESGTMRKYVWQGAVNAWKSSTKALLIGTGTETFAFAFYQNRPAGHNLTSEWDFLYNKAHNEYLNYLATTGTLGLGSYLLFIGVFIFWFVKSQIQNSKSKKNLKSQTQNSKQSENLIFEFNSDLGFRILNFALFAGWLSILVTNFFGFSVVILQIFLFLFPAMIIKTTQQFSRKLVLRPWTIWVATAGGLFLVIRIGSFWYADTLYARGYRMARAGQYASANASLTQAIAVNPGEPVYRDEIANTLASLSVAAFEAQNATLSAQFAQEALKQNDQAIRVSSKNVNVWKTRTKIYYTLSAFDPALNDAAITALERAATLSPNDPKIYYNLAILIGQSGDNEKAVEMLTKTITLKSNYRDAYYALYVFYTEMGKPADAKTVLGDYLTKVDPQDKPFRDILEKGKP